MLGICRPQKMPPAAIPVVREKSIGIGWGWILALALALWWGGGRMAGAGPTPAAQRPAPPRSVALFPVLGVRLSQQAILNKLTQELRRSLSAKKQSLLYGGRLNRKIRERPASAVSRCAADIPCLVRLGRRAGVDTVVVGRATSKGAGLRVLFVLVDVSRAAILDTVSISFASPRTVPKSIQPLVAALSPSGRPEAPDAGSVAKAGLPPAVDLSLPPLPDGEVTPPEEAADGLPPLRAVAPTRLAPDGPSSEKSAPKSTPTSVVAAAPPITQPPTAEETTPPTRSASAPQKRITADEDGGFPWPVVGVATLALAVGTAGAGTYFGVRSLDGQVKRDGRDQLEMVAQVQKANQDARLANGLFVGAGALALLGASCWIWDSLSESEPTEPSLRLSVSPEGVSLLGQW